MPYLSRVRINPLRKESRTLLANPRAMHSNVCAAVPATPDTERSLWRLDTDNDHRPYLVALTASKPDWTHLVEAAGWPAADEDHYTVADYSPLLAQLAVGREFNFRLTANPVQNTSRPIKQTDVQKKQLAQGTRRSFRIGHRTAEAQLAWLLARATKHGFEILPARTDPGLPDLPLEDSTPAPDVRILNRDRLSFSKKSHKPVVLHTVTFQGHMRVTDTELLSRALLQGIGPAKAYGCGLLTLAPRGGH
ncbi:type I-E CRISPR-associated protein Cas6/Cse3/CasE [Actinomadura sediminis]|uniref:Type I-E CRISPR-associated protein Cas6/Cse3/CasE n=1 Tax=Actinomadura sediminis TaxID=1038904 RepID=A0ABW3EIH4_9ACTN